MTIYIHASPLFLKGMHPQALRTAPGPTAAAVSLTGRPSPPGTADVPRPHGGSGGGPYGMGGPCPGPHGRPQAAQFARGCP